MIDGLPAILAALGALVVLILIGAWIAIARGRRRYPERLREAEKEINAWRRRSRAGANATTRAPRGGATKRFER